MLIDFFLHLRQAKLPVSIKEYLTLLEAMKQHVIGPRSTTSTSCRARRWSRTSATSTSSTARSAPTSRACRTMPGIDLDLPLEWLKRQLQREFTAEEKARSRRWAGSTSCSSG
jgi:uncharacterized protein